MQITSAMLKRLAPMAKRDRIDAIVAEAPRVLNKYEINTPLRMSMFFANLAHESGDFNIGRENTNYSAKNLATIWDKGSWHSYFSSKAALQKYAGRGEALLNIVYGGRMGNGPAKSGDGYRFRGGGLAQITGRDGYRTIGKITGLPLEEQPELVFDSRYMLECAAAFWRWKNLAQFADANDFVRLCMRWNGAKKASGVIGMADRQAKLKTTRAIFTDYLDRPGVGIMSADVAEDEAEDEADDLVTTAPEEPEFDEAPDSFTPLPDSRGDPRVFFVQTRLKGFHIPVGGIDGKWGGATSSGVARFVNDRELTTLSAPTSRAEFDAIFPRLLPEIRKAYDEKWELDVTEERKAADPAIVEQVAPEVVPQKRGFWASLWATICGIVATAYATAYSYIMAAWNWLTDNKDTGIVSWGKKVASEVPVQVWIAGATLLVAYLALNAWQANRISTEAVKTGERV